jgi:tRNA1(Val) A37 N6-methylase TrmN6
MKVDNVIEHYSHNGRILRFENLQDLYPVNRYQSLLMATNVHSEILAYIARSGKSVKNMRAVELCCGGGPAALVMKDIGIGYVEASDINPLAVEMCKRNATLNGLTIDKAEVRSMFDDLQDEEEKFDIIACNPPCGRAQNYNDLKNQHMRTAVIGGEKGVDFALELIKKAPDHLVPGGILAFVLTSTMDFDSVIAQLEQTFKGNWRHAYSTPIAQPYLEISSQKAKDVLKLRNEGKVFVWMGEDEMLWRMTWIMIAANFQPKESTFSSRLWFRPYGYDITAPSYLEILADYENRYVF